MNKVLILRTCEADMTSHNGFKWPESGPVEAPDWSPKPEIGHGLHGLLWGEGNHWFLDWQEDAKWLVVEVEEKNIIDLGGKVKFPSGVVVFCGGRKEATEFLYKHAPSGKRIAGATVIKGDFEVALSGGFGESMAGNHGIAISGSHGKSITGYAGKSLSGYKGIAKSGDYGVSESGDEGISISGKKGVSITGVDGEAASGEGGTIIIPYWDYSGRFESYRYAIGVVGENGIEPNKFYVVKDGKLTLKQL